MSILGLSTQEEDDSARGHEFEATRKILKYAYQPFYDNNRLYRYEDDPEEYRRARKRIQNRESALKVRAIKRQQDESCNAQLQELRLKNQELLIANAKLSSENQVLREQIAFLEKLTSQPLPCKHTVAPPSYSLEEPRQYSDQWEKASYFSGRSGKWSTLLLLTFVVAVVLYPQEGGQSQMTFAMLTNGTGHAPSESQQASLPGYKLLLGACYVCYLAWVLVSGRGQLAALFSRMKAQKQS